jgi:catechol 2,3-dioxygenase-like lactoylglutathione lyase family enzyme
MSTPSPYVITYFTNDLEANRRFYGDVIGLPLHSDLADVYFLAGAGGWRLQILQVEPDRPGRDTVSSGLVLFGVQTEEELSALHARLQAAGLSEGDGYRDPDGRIVMVKCFDPAYPFHD